MHDGMGTMNQAFMRTSALYRIGNHLRVGTQVDFAKRSSGFSLRYIPEISLHWASGEFRFMLRQWYMATHTPPSATAGSATGTGSAAGAGSAAGTGSAAGAGATASDSGAWAWSSTMRTKFQTIWQLPDSRFSLRAAIEPFYWDRLSKCRFYLGCSYRILPGNSIIIEALREQYFSRYSNNVIVLTWSVSL